MNSALPTPQPARNPMIPLLLGEAPASALNTTIRISPAISGTHVTGVGVGCYLRMLTARATTRATVTIETAACTVMPIFAQRDNGITSVGLNAAALVNDRYR